jgi:HTH-like domain
VSCGRGDPEGRDQRTDFLPLEGEVRRVGSRPGTPDGSAAGREHEVEAVGGGPNAGQDDAAGCALKKWRSLRGLGPWQRPMVDRLMSSYGASERYACRVLCVTRGTYRYRSCLDPRTELRMRIREIAQARVRYGYRKIRVLLNREGWDVGKYLVYRLCKEEGLMLKRMKPAGKRKAARLREEKVKPTAPDEAWSMDFVSDQLQGRDPLPFPDRRRCLYAGGGGDRGWSELEGRRCGAHSEQAETRTWRPQGVV